MKIQDFFFFFYKELQPLLASGDNFFFFFKEFQSLPSTIFIIGSDSTIYSNSTISTVRASWANQKM